MERYQIIKECSCSLQFLGEYASREDAEQAAAILEECGIQVEIQKIGSKYEK